MEPLHCGRSRPPSYDDATVGRFEEDTGVRVPVGGDDPERFQKRCEFLSSDAMRERWVAWRCEKTREFFLKARDRVRDRAPGADMFVSLYIDVPQTRAWTEQGVPLRQFLREWGHDPALMGADEHLWATRWMHALLHTQPARAML